MEKVDKWTKYNKIEYMYKSMESEYACDFWNSSADSSKNC